MAPRVDYEAVAAFYRQCDRFQYRQQMAEHFGAPVATVSRWVNECRRRGLLPWDRCPTCGRRQQAKRMKSQNEIAGVI